MKAGTESGMEFFVIFILFHCYKIIMKKAKSKKGLQEQVKLLT